MLRFYFFRFDFVFFICWHLCWVKGVRALAFTTSCFLFPFGGEVWGGGGMGEKKIWGGGGKYPISCHVLMRFSNQKTTINKKVRAKNKCLCSILSNKTSLIEGIILRMLLTSFRRNNFNNILKHFVYSKCKCVLVFIPVCTLYLFITFTFLEKQPLEVFCNKRCS